MLNTPPTIMNEKITVQDLIDILAERHDMSKKNAESFAKEFFQLIEESLEKDKYVKIKGLGSFKLIDVESRESVNVNTGERIEIQGHTKISFTPEPTLKDTINKPFSHFETVVLGNDIELEGVSQENEEEEDNDNDSKVSESEEKEQIAKGGVCEEVVVMPEAAAVAEPEEEMFAVLKEEVAIVPEEKTVVVPKKVYIVGGKTTAVEDTKAIDGEPQNAVEEAESDIEEPKEEINEDPAGPKAVTEAEKREKFIASLRDRAVLESELLVSEPKAVPDSSAMKYFVGIIIFVILLCGGAIIFIYYPDWFDKLTPEPPVVTDSQINQPIETDQNILMGDSIAAKDTIQPVKADTVAEIPVIASKPKETPKEDVLQPAPKEKQKEVNLVPFVPDSVDYTIVGTEMTYTIKEGETLTRVALRFYGTKKMWPYLVKHNADIIKNPDNVPYGTTIKIPKLVKKQ